MKKILLLTLLVLTPAISNATVCNTIKYPNFCSCQAKVLKKLDINQVRLYNYMYLNQKTPVWSNHELNYAIEEISLDCRHLLN